uniref:V-SNARE coiled-coil homology domain-containing protein n=1 Tax=Heterorhabditis bacteriophora TaxID=37862 RepID=A0A1I7XMR2_HETBA
MHRHHQQVLRVWKDWDLQKVLLHFLLCIPVLKEMVSIWTDYKMAPCLWVGTSTGATIALNLILPQDRLVSTVVIAPSVRVKAFGSARSMGTVIKLKGQVLYQAFMDQSLCLLGPASESYKETSRDSKDSASPEKTITNRILTKSSLSPTYSNSIDLSEEISQVVVLSLPSLRVLHQASLIPHSIDVEDSYGNMWKPYFYAFILYLINLQIEKYTICSELSEQTEDSLGELFVPCDMPEAPKNTSFLKGVSNMFGGTPRQEPSDIDNILVDKEKNSASTMRSVARIIPGPSLNMERAHAGGISAGQAAVQALQNLNERGNKLNATVDVTENLRNNALNLSQRTGKLVEKYEKKKWYNF